MEQRNNTMGKPFNKITILNSIVIQRTFGCNLITYNMFELLGYYFCEVQQIINA